MTLGEQPGLCGSARLSKPITSLARIRLLPELCVSLYWIACDRRLWCCVCVCVCPRVPPCTYVCVCVYCAWMRCLWISEWDTPEWIQQLSFLTSNFNIVPLCLLARSFPNPLLCSPLCSPFVHHRGGMIDGAVETANVKVCGPWTDSSAWISVARSKRWELDEQERGRCQHFPSHAFSLHRIESYYLTRLLFPP